MCGVQTSLVCIWKYEEFSNRETSKYKRENKQLFKKKTTKMSDFTLLDIVPNTRTLGRKRHLCHMDGMSTSSHLRYTPSKQHAVYPPFTYQS